LAELAEAWETRFRTWRVSGFGAIREAWLAVAAGLGQPIEVRLPGETLTGRFETLMPDGALSLLLPDRSRRAITAGEVFFA
jgi:BirA family biotin operon repressor/biotin-[acetyl-CoA-carboxylase] ligase